MFEEAKFARVGLVVDPIDDNRHSLSGSPIARESSPFLVHLPDEGIAAFTYTWVNGAGEAGAAYAIFGPGVGDTPLEGRLPDRLVPAQMDFADWQVGDYSLKQDLAFGHAESRYKGDGVEIEILFDAFHPPYAYGSNVQPCPAYTAANRIEQSGKVQGRLVLGDRTVSFDTVGHRDHSWGTRDWGAFQHYQWFEGQSADASTSVHFWRFWGLGLVNTRGYVFKNGLLAEITELEVDVRYSDDLWQKQMSATVTDEAGRKIKISCEFYADYTLKADPKLHLRDCAARATFDGSTGVGWLEIAWPPAYLEHVKANGPY